MRWISASASARSVDTARGWIRTPDEPRYRGDTAVGSVYYRDVDHTFNSAEYGIFVGEESARGKGFGTETARLFTDFGFTALHLHRISLRVLAENTPARRSYAAAGFVEEGTFRDMVRLDGVYRDVVFMAKIAQ